MERERPAHGLRAGAGVVVASGFVLLGRSRYAGPRGRRRHARQRAILLAALGGVVCAAAPIAGFVALTKT
ncbi:MAG: hypothetical protein ACXVFN_22890 [Solirubrobacteraceae bacterium]